MAAAASEPVGGSERGGLITLDNFPRVLKVRGMVERGLRVRCWVAPCEALGWGEVGC